MPRPAGTHEWTIALVDLDAFKNVNDRYGHLAGDEFLRAISRRLDRAVADGDVMGRWGGDEFLLALPVAADRVEPVLRRVQDLVTRVPVTTSAGPVPAEVTIGAAEWSVGDTFDEVLRRADDALYEGKSHGGARLVIALPGR